MGNTRPGKPKSDGAKAGTGIRLAPSWADPSRTRTCSNIFLDSGAYSLYTKHIMGKSPAVAYQWFKSPEFKAMLDDYAGFVNKYKQVLDVYCTLDVSGNPQMTWDALKYLEEKHGLKPLPVVHPGTAAKWMEKYIKAGYDYIGVGGIAGFLTARSYYRWADHMFEVICSGPGHLPVIRPHGLAVTSVPLMWKYPFYSCDSASWCQLAGYGGVFVPHRRNGRWLIDKQPWSTFVSTDSLFRKMKGRHLTTLAPAEQELVKQWSEDNGIPMGARGPDGITTEWGLTSEYAARAILNMKFFDAVAKALPPYPWPFRRKTIRGFFDKKGR